ncbi:hypothetical protein GCM10015535_34010 [Streptomyces gelaticus]|uniref:Uncharacterized protein n=1 Tax=Streptomyces gelaticus TaxID=285446 RepID=A0ABQ2VZ81_9ACTN|nr:hypothetical protein [Streptomyces gelaticus]GGV86233.1 hypothetical protein GCM10015535_34010 [Streptomyces gelaticus]
MTTDGPAFAALGRAMADVYGKPMAALGQVGSIPLCNVITSAFPVPRSS